MKMNLVRADFGEEMNNDILKFCLAKMNKEKVETETAPERRRVREQVKTYTNMMAERMKSNGSSVVHLQSKANLPESWVVLKPLHGAPMKLSAGSVIDVLKTTNIEELQVFHSQNITEVLKEHLVGKLSRQHLGKYTVSVQTKPPRVAKQIDLTSQNPDLLEVAKNLVESRVSSKIALGNLKRITCKQDNICQLATPSVERYINRVNPVMPIAPVQVQIGATHNKFYVRSREVKKPKNLTLKVLIPMCGEVIKETLHKNGMGDDLTTRTLANLQMPQILNAISETLQARIDSFKETNVETTNKITLERGLPSRVRM